MSVRLASQTSRVFTSQLRAGFAYRGILPGYLDDWRSAAFATMLVWENYAARTATGAARTEDRENAALNFDHFRRDRLS